MLESRQKVLSGETGLNVEQKITEVQETVRKAKVGVINTLTVSPSGPPLCWTLFSLAEGSEHGAQQRRCVKIWEY